MRLLIVGGGDIANAVKAFLHRDEFTVEIADKHDCDVTDAWQVEALFTRRPDFVLVTAGVSIPGSAGLEELLVNLYGSMNVARECAFRGIPVILMASVAGMQGKAERHLGYSASKAGVLSVVQSLAADGHRIWAVSPGRVDTSMRERDYPGEAKNTRLQPSNVARAIEQILHGCYAPGANVVIRRVGTTGRVDMYEEPRWGFPSLSS